MHSPGLSCLISIFVPRAGEHVEMTKEVFTQVSRLELSGELEWLLNNTSSGANAREQSVKVMSPARLGYGHGEEMLRGSWSDEIKSATASLYNVRTSTPATEENTELVE